MEKVNRLIVLFLLAAVFLTAGCEMFYSHSNPLAGWHPFYGKVDQPVVDDYQNYIEKLSPREKKYLGPYPVSFFEDGTGQHAVEIRIGLDGTDWRYVLIYNKDNERIKTIKYVAGHYAC